MDEMSQFEYLQRVSIGQYLPIDSPVHRLDPRTKMISLGLLIAAITLSGNLMSLSAGLIISFLLVVVSRIPIPFAFKGLLPPLPFLILTALIQLVITPHGEADSIMFQLWNIPVYTESILTAIRLILRFISLLFLLGITSATISTIEMINGLDLLLKPLQKIGVHTENAAIIVQLTLRFIPFLAINAGKIAKSQASRGARWDAPDKKLFGRVRQIIPLLIPLFITSLQQAENLSIAMLARGFRSGSERTSMHAYHFSFRDGLVLFLTVLITASLVVMPFILR